MASSEPFVHSELKFTEDFEYPTMEMWREAVVQSLKGLPFEKLLTKTYENITIQPMYSQEVMATLPHTASIPGSGGYVRGTHPLGYLQKLWHVSQELPYAAPAEVNSAAKHDLQRGQTELHIVLDAATRAGKDADRAPTDQVGRGGTSISCLPDVTTLLDHIDLPATSIFVQAGTQGLPLLALFAAYLKEHNVPRDTMQGCIGSDPLGVLVQEGELAHLTSWYDQLAVTTRWATQHAPRLQTILVQGNPYREAGGSAVQELAFTLATGVAYIRELQHRGLSIDEIAPRMRFSFAIGSDFFMEVAKFRTARLLWAQIVNAFGGSEDAQKMAIHARTCRWNKTVFDPYVNMLRVTVEALAAVLGGCDSLHISPFDEIIRHPDEFSRRIARNVHIILREESNLYRLVDPAGGSWYVEQLTGEVGQQAWRLFQQIESEGGMLNALKAGIPQRQVQAVANQRRKHLSTRKDRIVGTNMYPNLVEKKVERRPFDHQAFQALRREQLTTVRKTAAPDRWIQFDPNRPIETGMEAVRNGATLGEFGTHLTAGGESITITPLGIHRGAEFYEELRQKVEAMPERPTVILLKMGAVKYHKARADFSRGFFEVGAFTVMDEHVFDSPEAAASAAVTSGAHIAVICSTDDQYPELVPPIAQSIKAEKPEMHVILAGYPKDQIETYNAAGVDEFIHVKANVYEILSHLVQTIAR